MKHSVMRLCHKALWQLCHKTISYKCFSGTPLKILLAGKLWSTKIVDSKQSFTLSSNAGTGEHQVKSMLLMQLKHGTPHTGFLMLIVHTQLLETPCRHLEGRTVYWGKQALPVLLFSPGPQEGTGFELEWPLVWLGMIILVLGCIVMEQNRTFFWNQTVLFNVIWKSLEGFAAA